MHVTDRPTVDQVLPLAVAYYETHPTGGVLHCVLDDNNLEDVFVGGAVEQAEADGDHEGEVLARLLALMTRAQRGRVAKRALWHRIAETQRRYGKVWTPPKR